MVTHHFCIRCHHQLNVARVREETLASVWGSGASAVSLVDISVIYSGSEGVCLLSHVPPGLKSDRTLEAICLRKGKRGQDSSALKPSEWWFSILIYHLILAPTKLRAKHFSLADFNRCWMNIKPLWNKRYRDNKSSVFNARLKLNRLCRLEVNAFNSSLRWKKDAGYQAYSVHTLLTDTQLNGTCWGIDSFSMTESG